MKRKSLLILLGSIIVVSFLYLRSRRNALPYGISIDKRPYFEGGPAIRDSIGFSIVKIGSNGIEVGKYTNYNESIYDIVKDSSVVYYNVDSIVGYRLSNDTLKVLVVENRYGYCVVQFLLSEGSNTEFISIREVGYLNRKEWVII